MKELKNSYLAVSDKLDKKTVNDWACKHTNGKIKEVVKKVGPATLLIVLNVMHFKAKWLEQFNSFMTDSLEFQVDKGGVT